MLLLFVYILIGEVFVKALYFVGLLCVPLMSLSADLGNIDYCKANGFDRSILASRQALIWKALKKHDIKLMSRQVSFPLRVNQKNAKPLIIKNAAEFKRLYDFIFTGKDKAKFMRHARQHYVGKQDYICRYDGAGLFNGVIWLAPTKASKIKSVNPY